MSVGVFLRVWVAGLVAASGCDREKPDPQSDEEGCEEWFNREYGFDVVSHYKCSTSKADCGLSDLDFSVALYTTVPAALAGDSSSQELLAVSAVAANNTDSDLTYTPDTGCFVDRVIVRGSESGTSVSGECGGPGRSWIVPKGTKVEIEAMTVGAEEFGVGKLRVLMQFSPEEANCCVCSTWSATGR